MSLPILLSCLWVLAAAGVAMLPMRRQYVPGLALLIAAPVLIAWLAVAHGPWLPLVAALAVISMYRRPLGYFLGRALGNRSAGGRQE